MGNQSPIKKTQNRTSSLISIVLNGKASITEVCNILVVCLPEKELRELAADAVRESKGETFSDLFKTIMPADYCRLAIEEDNREVDRETIGRRVTT